MNGIVYYLSHVSLQRITDGTSNTFAFGERAHGKFPRAPSENCWNWWTSGNYGDTMFCTLYGINTWNKAPFNRPVGREVRDVDWAGRDSFRPWAASIPAAPTSASAMARSSSSRTRSAVGMINPAYSWLG